MRPRINEQEPLGSWGHLCYQFYASLKHKSRVSAANGIHLSCLHPTYLGLFISHRDGCWLEDQRFRESVFRPGSWVVGAGFQQAVPATGTLAQHQRAVVG